MDDSMAILAGALVERIRPILAGHPPDVQSAALGDLVAMYLAGHQDADDPESDAVKALREELLTIFIDLVRTLVPVNAAIIRKRQGMPLV